MDEHFATLRNHSKCIVFQFICYLATAEVNFGLGMTLYWSFSHHAPLQQPSNPCEKRAQSEAPLPIASCSAVVAHASYPDPGTGLPDVITVVKIRRKRFDASLWVILVSDIYRLWGLYRAHRTVYRHESVYFLFSSAQKVRHKGRPTSELNSAFDFIQVLTCTSAVEASSDSKRHRTTQSFALTSRTSKFPGMRTVC